MPSFSNHDHAAHMDESGFEQLVVQIRTAPDAEKKLLALLREQNPVYAGKSTAAVTRMRGFILYHLSFSTVPDLAILFLYEELESSREPYLIAAASMALRKANWKEPKMGKLLIKALFKIRSNDIYISFDTYYQQHPLTNKTTATAELLKSIEWLGAYAKPALPDLEALVGNADGLLKASTLSSILTLIEQLKNNKEEIKDCCRISNYGKPIQLREIQDQQFKKASIEDIKLEDHNGQISTYSTFFKGQYALVAFFYTRCDNPLKCSLTITNLAEIQSKLSTAALPESIKIAAISYDSFYDKPELLKAYGTARGLVLNNNTRMFRVNEQFEELKQYFDLGVNFIGEVVNRHIIELYLVNPDGDIVMSFEREQMDNDAIIAQIKSLHFAATTKKKNALNRITAALKSAASVMMSVLVLLLPKCPLCFAAYFSVIGIAGAEMMPYVKYLFPMLLIAMTINLYALYRMGKKQQHFLPFYLCIVGSVLVVTFGHYLSYQPGLILGIGILLMGAILNAIPKMQYLRWKHRLTPLLL